MYGLEYLDEDLVERCKKLFLMVYPDTKPVVLGACRDKKSLLVECEFPDGIFYYKVTDDSVSRSFNSLDEADRTEQI